MVTMSNLYRTILISMVLLLQVARPLVALAQANFFDTYNPVMYSEEPDNYAKYRPLFAPQTMSESESFSTLSYPTSEGENEGDENESEGENVEGENVEGENVKPTLAEEEIYYNPVELSGAEHFVSAAEASVEDNSFDRHINRHKFVYRGEFVMGVMATHGDIFAAGSDVLLVLSDITGSASFTYVNPYFGYTYSDNLTAGVRFGYTELGGTLDAATLDLGSSSDLSFAIPYVSYNSEVTSYGLFHRSYAALDKGGQFALFADVDLGATTSKTIFEMEVGETLITTKSRGWGVALNFNPGVAVYVLPNVCTTLSFGLGGISYTSTKQYDAEDNFIGDKRISSLDFKLNLLAIKLGVNIHLWKK